MSGKGVKEYALGSVDGIGVKLLTEPLLTRLGSGIRTAKVFFFPYEIGERTQRSVCRLRHRDFLQPAAPGIAHGDENIVQVAVRMNAMFETVIGCIVADVVLTAAVENNSIRGVELPVGPHRLPKSGPL